MPQPKFMAAKVPLEVHVMTPEDVSEYCGRDEPESIEEIEILFGNVSEIASLERCIALRSLTLINCNLRIISGLAPVSMTLERLCLVDQKLTKMEGLALPCLRELLLQQNEITCIQGLEGCPRLQRLWLFENKLTRLEGLSECGELRELCVQSNRIERIGSALNSTVHLESLALADNKLSDFHELSRLKHLPLLKEVSLRDLHFGVCPVTQLDGYRNAVLLSLPQLMVLDGIEVGAEDRQGAKDAYFAHIAAFNGKIQELARQHERDAEQVAQRRRRVNAHAEVLTAELATAFQSLEGLVMSGRQSIAQEQQRQAAVRADNAAVLEKNLQRLAKQHSAEVDRRIAAEVAAGEEEARLFDVLEMRAAAEAAQAQVLAQMHYGSSGSSGLNTGGVGCTMLSEHGPSFQLIAKHVRAAQLGGSSSGGGIVAAKAYRLLSSHLAAAHAPLEQASLKANRQLDRRTASEIDSAESPEGQAMPHAAVSDETSGASGRWRKLYWSGSTAAQASLLARGFGSGVASQGGLVCLHSDPALALSLHGRASLGDASVLDQKGLGTLGAVVAVTCAFDEGSNEGGLKQGPVLKQRPLNEESLAALVEPSTADGAQTSDIVEVRYPTSSGGGSKEGVVVLVPMSALVSAKVSARLLPETHLLLASGTLAQDSKRIEAALDDLSQRGAPLFPGESSAGSSETLLSELEAAVEDEVSYYAERVWAEVDSQTADQLRDADAQISQRNDEANSLRYQIETERDSQEQILKDFRNKAQGLGHNAPQQQINSNQQQQQRVLSDKRGMRPNSASIYGADPRDRRG